jgi:hypothetical protein
VGPATTAGPHPASPVLAGKAHAVIVQHHTLARASCTPAPATEDRTTPSTPLPTIHRRTTTAVVDHVDRWEPTARAGAIIVGLFGGMAGVSQLAAVHATAACWTLGTTVLFLLIIMITSAVRSSSPLMPDLPSTGQHQRTAEAIDHHNRSNCRSAN